MTQLRTVAVAGFDETQLRILEAACRDLPVPTIQISLEVWDGTRKDLIVVNPDHPTIAESAIRLTTRRGGRHLNLPVAVSGNAMATRQAVQRAILSALGNASADVAIAGNSHSTPANASLFDRLKDLIVDGVNVSATCSSCQVLILPDAGKVRAKNELAFGMFRTFFARTDWEIRPLLEPLNIQQYSASHSLDSFLTDACLRIRFRLPTVTPGPFKLSVYPDLGEMTGQSDVLKMASFAMRPQVSVKALAELAEVDVSRANAFVLAATMLGLVEAIAIEPEMVAISDLDSGKVERRSIWTRIARRFGLGIVKEETENV